MNMAIKKVNTCLFNKEKGRFPISDCYGRQIFNTKAINNTFRNFHESLNTNTSELMGNYSPNNNLDFLPGTTDIGFRVMSAKGISNLYDLLE